MPLEQDNEQQATVLTLKLSVLALTAREESRLEGNHIVIKCSIGTEPYDLTAQALCDTGATGFAFIDGAFAKHHNLPKFKLRTLRALDVIEGRPITSEDITHIVKVPLRIGAHQEELPVFITTLGHYKLVLGVP